MCRTSSPPRRDLYDLEQTLTAEKQKTAETTPEPTGSFLLPGSDRHWAYQGTETHYGYTYHLWQNALTQRKYAWEVVEYRQAATKENQ